MRPRRQQTDTRQFTTEEIGGRHASRIVTDDIVIPPDRLRALNTAKVTELAADIQALGYLIHPITVYQSGEDHVLVAGYYRLEAFKALGHMFIQAFELPGEPTDRERRMIEIAENLHRYDLDSDERIAQQKLWDLTHRGSDGKPLPAREVERLTGTPKSPVIRRRKIGSISPAAKQAAKAGGIVSTKALLEVAAQPDEEAQMQAVKDAVEGPKVSDLSNYATLISLSVGNACFAAGIDITDDLHARIITTQQAAIPTARTAADIEAAGVAVVTAEEERLANPGS